MLKIGALIFLLVSPVLSFEETSFYSSATIKPKKHVLNVDEFSLENIWKNIEKEHKALRKDVLKLAFEGYLKMVEKGLLAKGKPLTIIDFDLPLSKERLWVIDIIEQDIEYASLVAHGRNSGDLHASKFSNVPESNMSSLGFYLTGETYTGKHGASLRLDGMEKGINDNARKRAIVIHSAQYAERSFVKQHGRLGRSLGCPALPDDNYDEIISLIKEKSCLFIHASEKTYLGQSAYLGHLASI
jgi:hypothetical protein